MSIEIITFYKFVQLDNLEELKLEILQFCKENNIKGTILLALEGINATVAGSDANIQKFQDFLCSIPEFNDIKFKSSFAKFMPFQKMKVRLKNEIVKIARQDLQLDAQENYVQAEQWNDLLNDSETILLDTRNTYETKFGKFAGAITPEIENFHEFPAWFEEFLQKNSQVKEKKIAMYCTGGIRCEKSVSYVKSLGLKKVFHLQDGILAYLQQDDNKEKWQGDCFVFDDRVALDKNMLSINNFNCYLCKKKTDLSHNLQNVTKGKVLCKKCADAV